MKRIRKGTIINHKVRSRENQEKGYIPSTTVKIQMLKKENHTARRRMNGKTSIKYQDNRIHYTIF